MTKKSQKKAPDFRLYEPYEDKNAAREHYQKLAERDGSIGASSDFSSNKRLPAKKPDSLNSYIDFNSARLINILGFIDFNARIRIAELSPDEDGKFDIQALREIPIRFTSNIKYNEETTSLYDILRDNGFILPDKPINDKAPTIEHFADMLENLQKSHSRMKTSEEAYHIVRNSIAKLLTITKNLTNPEIAIDISVIQKNPESLNSMLDNTYIYQNLYGTLKNESLREVFFDLIDPNTQMIPHLYLGIIPRVIEQLKPQGKSR